MARKPRKIQLSRQKYDWAKNRDTYLTGEPLRVNPVYADRQAETVMREVRRMHLDVSKQVKALFRTEQSKETIQEIAMDASITSQARILTNKLARDWDKRFRDFAKTFSKHLFDDMESMTAQDMQDSMEKLTGNTTINATSVSESTRDVIGAGTQQSTSLIKSISEEYMSEVQEALMRSIASPKGSYTATIESIDKMLQGRFRVYKNKAKNITLDQTRKAYNSITDSRMRSVGVTKYRWRHAGGSQEPRPYHKNELNGQVFSLDDPPIIDRSTGERGHPGDAINCFPGDSKVNYFFGVNRAYRHFYCGKSTEIITDNGSILKSTPNHPVLTQRGWVAAHLVKRGDYVVDVGENGISTLESNAEKIEIPISDIFSALSLIGLVESTAPRVGDLHGDVTDKKIDIVSAKWMLGGDIEPTSREGVYKVLLSMPDTALDFPRVPSSLFKFVKGSTLAPDSIVCRFCNLLAVGFSGAGHPEFSSLLDASNLEPFLLQKFRDVSPGYTELLRDLKHGRTTGMKFMQFVAWDFLGRLLADVSSGYLDTDVSELNAEVVRMATELDGYFLERHAGGQQFSRVVEKRSGILAEHVYNLEMNDGLYITQNIAVSNCKCFKEPILEFGNPEKSS